MRKYLKKRVARDWNYVNFPTHLSNNFSATSTMTNQTQEHPAKKFGVWLRSKRQLRNVVARVFALKIWLSHAKYAEIELGIIEWMSPRQELLIPMALGLTPAEK